MTVRPRGDVFLADFMVAGKRYRETFDTYAEADEWEKDARHALDLGRPLPAVKNGRAETGGPLSTLGALFDYAKAEHWENNPKIVRPDTAITQATKVVDFFGRNKPVIEIDGDEMRRMVRDVVARGNSYATGDRRLAALSTMLRIAYEKGVIPRKPKIPLSGETNERFRFLTKDEAKRILTLWREWDQPDLHAFTVFALHTGARLQANLDIKWNAFSPAFNTVLFWGGDKKAKARTLPLSPSAREAILEMKRMHPDSTGPFAHLKKDGRLRTMWDRMQAHLGFDDVVIHTLRHTCASWLVQGGVDLKRVQTWLGHKRIETTLIYAKLGTGDLDAAADVLGDALAPTKPILKIVNGSQGE